MNDDTTKPAAVDAKPTMGPRIDLEALRQVDPETVAQVEKLTIDLTPEELELLLEVAFFQASKFILNKMHRETVTEVESQKWAKVTRIVYGKYLTSFEAGLTVWVLMTAGIFLGKKPLPPSTKTE